MLSLDNIYKSFYPGQGIAKEMTVFINKLIGRSEKIAGVQAVRGVSLDVRPGEILGLLGESGSGKSTLGRLMSGLYRPDRGEIFYKGQSLASFNKNDWKTFRKRVQIMFQDPVSSLNPRLTAGSTVEEGLIIHALGTSVERKERVEQLLAEVGLPPESIKRYGHEFSGGQRQRLSLARALALGPELLIADEPVSALDVSIQAQIINLLMELREKRGLALVLISHDLPLVRIMADRLAVMYGGLILECIDKALLGKVRHHPYVMSLWASAGGGGELILEGEPPDPQNPPEACPFSPRCRESKGICRELRPELKKISDGFLSACHFRS